jgi:hypothetical protein
MEGGIECLVGFRALVRRDRCARIPRQGRDGFKTVLYTRIIQVD